MILVKGLASVTGAAIMGAFAKLVGAGTHSPEGHTVVTLLLIAGIAGGAAGGGIGGTAYGFLRDKMGPASSGAASTAVAAVITGLFSALVGFRLSSPGYGRAGHVLRMGIGGGILGAITGLAGAGTVGLMRHLAGQ